MATPFEESEKYFLIGIIKSVIMAKTTRTRVSNYKPFIGKPLPGDKRPGFNPDICLYEVEDNDMSDSGY